MPRPGAAHEQYPHGVALWEGGGVPLAKLLCLQGNALLAVARVYVGAKHCEALLRIDTRCGVHFFQNAGFHAGAELFHRIPHITGIVTGFTAIVWQHMVWRQTGRKKQIQLFFVQLLNFIAKLRRVLVPHYHKPCVEGQTAALVGYFPEPRYGRACGLPALPGLPLRPFAAHSVFVYQLRRRLHFLSSSSSKRVIPMLFRSSSEYLRWP